jgi:hypothetical protein
VPSPVALLLAFGEGLDFVCGLEAWAEGPMWQGMDCAIPWSGPKLGLALFRTALCTVHALFRTA